MNDIRPCDKRESSRTFAFDMNRQTAATCRVDWYVNAAVRRPDEGLDAHRIGVSVGELITPHFLAQ